MTASRPLALLRGLAALAALAVILLAIPLWLNAVAGSPIPANLPSGDLLWSKLTSRDDGTLLLALLKYAAWAGWSLFLVSVAADVFTRLRGLPAPRLGPQQQVATRLVGAVAALVVILPTQGAALAAVASTPPDAVSTAPAGAAAPTGWLASLTGQVDAVDQPSAADQGYSEYTVRGGDCLWDIAWNELGEPELWPEIYEASRSVDQPDGHRLTDPDLILPGWVLHIPAPDEDGARSRSAVTRPPQHPGWGDAGRSEDPPEHDSVVTPFRGTTGNSGRRTPSEPAQHGGDPTQLVTPMTGAPSAANAPTSEVEARWQAALTAHRRVGDLKRGWQQDLLPPWD